MRVKGWNGGWVEGCDKGWVSVSECTLSPSLSNLALVLVLALDCLI